MNKEQKKQSVRKLWEMCFDDPKEFVDLFFDEIYGDEQNVSIEKDGEIICSAQCIPDRMHFSKYYMSIGYIYGVCTHPDHRGKGLATKLLETANSKLRYEGRYLSIVVPESEHLFDYYASRGFATCFYQNLIKEPKGQSQYCYDGLNVAINLISSDGLFNFYESLQQQKTCSLIHIKDYFDIVIKDFKQSGGKICGGLAPDTEILAIAFLEEDKAIKQATIKECLGKQNTDTALYRLLKEKYEKEDWSIVWKRETDKSDKEAIPYGMARIINTEKMLTIWAEEHPEFMKVISIDDDAISPENNGTFLLAGGLCSRCNVRSNVERYRIVDLTHKILTEHSASIALMFD
ncbi:MAG: GNAT family N-acetyltransferase [Bacteroidaceae bacterium]